MPSSTRRLLTIVGLLTVASAVGFVVSYQMQWPSTFVIGDVADTKVTLEDLVAGTPLSIPAIPWTVMLVLAAIARSQRWWGALAVLLLGAMGGVFITGGLGEALGDDNPHVPRTVLIAASVIWVSLGVLLVATALGDLVRRARALRASRP